jgi:hypothetical protein
MRSRIVRNLAVTALVAVAFGLALWSYAGEPSESKEVAALKGRATAPKEADIDHAATIEALLARKGPTDWSTAKGAILEGYVIQVELDEDGDVHLVLAAKAGETSTLSWVIAEVPPKWQAKSPTMSVKSLRAMVGKQVKVTGWLFYDAEPVADPRGTLWELHPVTSVSTIAN